MLIIYAFFGLLILVAVGLALLTLRQCWRRSQAGAIVAALTVLGAAFLLFPIPIHGGFTILGEVLWNELAAQREQVETAVDRAEDRAFAEHLAKRFAGPLVSRPLRPLAHPWQLVDTGNGLRAYFQQDVGLIWSDLLLWPSPPDPPELAAARSFCQTLDPAGYWALPSEGELYQFWAAGGSDISPGLGHRSMAVLIDRDLRLEAPTFYAGTRPDFALRCVALGPDAPPGGYSQKDVPRAAWNRFQLDKTSIYLTRRN